MGGYITGTTAMCDFVRSFASGFSFTHVPAAGDRRRRGRQHRHLKASSVERERQQDRVAVLRRRLDQFGIPHLRNPSHIVPVMVGQPREVQVDQRRAARPVRNLHPADQLPDRAAWHGTAAHHASPFQATRISIQLVGRLGRCGPQCALSRAVA